MGLLYLQFKSVQNCIYANIYCSLCFLGYNGFMKTSQQRLLDFIQAHQIVSAADLSLALKMTQANARHHLKALLSQGLIEIAGERQQPEKGRPAQLYRISSQKYGDNLDRFANAALVEILRLAGVDSYPESLNRIASEIAGTPSPGESAGHGSEGKTLTQRLGETISRLNKLHYESRWEAHKDAPRIVLGRCPYQPLIDGHPELCQMDAHLLETILGSQVKQTAKLVRDSRGSTYCLFKTTSTSVKA